MFAIKTFDAILPLLAVVLFVCCHTMSEPSILSPIVFAEGSFANDIITQVDASSALSLKERRTQLRVADCTLASQSIDDCDLMNYIFRVVIEGGVSVLIFVVMFFFFPFYLSFRCCCNCCGGRRQTYGYCLPHSREDEQIRQAAQRRAELEEKYSIKLDGGQNNSFRQQTSQTFATNRDEIDKRLRANGGRVPTIDSSPTGVSTSNDLTFAAVKYSLFDIIRVKGVYLGCLALFAGSVAWGVIEAGSILSAVNKIIDGFQVVPDVILARVDSIVGQMNVQSYDSSTDSYSTINFMLSTTEGADAYREINTTASNMKELIVDATEGVQTLLKTYDYVPMLILVLPAIFPLFGAVLAVFNLRRVFPLINAGLMCFMGSLMWILHIVVAILSIVLTDVNNEISAVLNNNLNVVSALTGCNDGDFTAVRSTFTDLAQSEARSLCADIKCYDNALTPFQNLQDGKVVDCTPIDGGAMCPTITPLVLFDKLEFEISLHANIKLVPFYLDQGLWCSADEPTCLLPSCSETCLKQTATYAPDSNETRVLSDVGKIAKEAIVTLRSVRNVLHVFDKNAVLLSSCEPIMSIALAPLHGPFVSLRNALVNIRTASGLYGLAFIVGAIVMIWGAKRFVSIDVANVELIDGVAVDDESGKPGSVVEVGTTQ